MPRYTLAVGADDYHLLLQRVLACGRSHAPRETGSVHVCTVPSAPWAAPQGWLSSQHPKFLHLRVSQPTREQVESLTQGEEQPSRTLCAGRASLHSPAEPFPLGDPVESRVRFLLPTLGKILGLASSSCFQGWQKAHCVVFFRQAELSYLLHGWSSTHPRDQHLPSCSRGCQERF